MECLVSLAEETQTKRLAGCCDTKNPSHDDQANSWSRRAHDCRKPAYEHTSRAGIHESFPLLDRYGKWQAIQIPRGTRPVLHGPVTGVEVVEAAPWLLDLL